jgi:arabinofuranosyltransferase
MGCARTSTIEDEETRRASHAAESGRWQAPCELSFGRWSTSRPPGWLNHLAVAALWTWCAYAWFFHTRLVHSFAFDDAFITLRYARNLVEHGVLSFNPDDRIDGYTSLGWTLMLAVALALGVDGEVAMRSLSSLFGLLAAFAAALLARRLGASRLLAVGIAGFGTVSTPGFVVWSVSGMETSYTAALATTLLWVYAMPRTHVVRWARLVVALACVTARPECVVAYLVLLASEVWTAARNHAELPLRARLGATCRELWPHLAVCAVLVGLFAAHWAYYGYPLPNTYYAKRATQELTRRGIDDLGDFLTQSVVLFAGLALVARLAARRWDRQGWMCAAFGAWGIATLAVYARAGGDFAGFHRYYQPLVPASFAVVAAAIAGAVRATGWRGLLCEGLAALVPVLALPALARTQLSRAFRDDLGQVRYLTTYVRDWREAAAALKFRFPASTVMAVRAAGIIPWVTGFKTLDLLALNNPEIAHANEPVRAVPGHQLEATVDQLLAWQPDIIVRHPMMPEEDLTGRPAGGRTAPENTPFVRAGYVYECAPLLWRDGYVCYWVVRDKARPVPQRRRPPLKRSP